MCKYVDARSSQSCACVSLMRGLKRPLARGSSTGNVKSIITGASRTDWPMKEYMSDIDFHIRKFQSTGDRNHKNLRRGRGVGRREKADEEDEEKGDVVIKIQKNRQDSCSCWRGVLNSGDKEGETTISSVARIQCKVGC